MSIQIQPKATETEIERLRNAVREFHGAYLKKFGRPSTGGARANAPLRDELGKLLLVAYADPGK